MAGFASGVIDSFQYFGAAIALRVTGRLLSSYGWNAWYPTMLVFAGIGVGAMALVIRRQRRMGQLRSGS
jgi:sugar phosphate permease